MIRLLSGALILALSAPGALADDAGDPRKIDFLPFAQALQTARKTKRLLFVKPIYGGVDAAGARDYRCGSW